MRENRGTGTGGVKPPPPPPMYFGILAYACHTGYARCKGMASTQTALLDVPKFAALSKKVNAVKTESAGATSDIREAPALARREEGRGDGLHVLLRCGTRHVAPRVLKSCARGS
eukprot:scaffold9484_cov124-Isochrysis_galbana.AAC.15